MSSEHGGPDRGTPCVGLLDSSSFWIFDHNYYLIWQSWTAPVGERIWRWAQVSLWMLCLPTLHKRPYRTCVRVWKAMDCLLLSSCVISVLNSSVSGQRYAHSSPVTGRGEVHLAVPRRSEYLDIVDNLEDRRKRVIDVIRIDDDNRMTADIVTPLEKVTPLQWTGASLKIMARLIQSNKLNVHGVL